MCEFRLKMLEKRKEIRSGKSKDAVTARMSFKRLFLSQQYEKEIRMNVLCVFDREDTFTSSSYQGERGIKGDKKREVRMKRVQPS